MLPNDVYNSACSTTPKGPTCPEGSGPDYDFGSPAILVTTTGGRELLLAGQKSGIVWAFDPDKNGEVMWETRVGQGGINGGVQWGMASDGEHVYAATSDVVVDADGDGAHARSDGRRRPHGAAHRRRQRRSGAPTPPPCAGRPNCSPAQSAALTAIPGVVFSGSLDGHLRAYSTRDGEVIWDFDTVREYETVNGVKAQRRRDRRPGAVVANGMVFVNSGYMRFGGSRATSCWRSRRNKRIRAVYLDRSPLCGDHSGKPPRTCVEVCLRACDRSKAAVTRYDPPNREMW